MNIKDQDMTKVKIFEHGIELQIPIGEKEVTNKCMRFEDILRIEYDKDIEELFILFKGNNNLEHYTYGSLLEEGYNGLRRAFLNYK
jgi:hypothetical protein